ncbi:protein DETOXIFICATION 14 [Citrus sinensis]|uniref:Protein DETOXIFICATION 14 n=1 Tax=Citrus sinensis TaxID=2711 RepID=A0ACB8NC01_CITSI|nr:protein DETOXIFICATION 14 [Citrus sinensis]
MWRDPRRERVLWSTEMSVCVVCVCVNYLHKSIPTAERVKLQLGLKFQKCRENAIHGVGRETTDRQAKCGETHVPASVRDKEEMDKGLLAKDEVEGREDLTVLLAKDKVECGEDLTVVTADVYIEEVKRLGSIAGPMVAVNLSQYSLQVISVMMVGHLGELFLSSTAIAISFSAVTGFSLLFGMSTAMETLSGQAHGAQQYRKLGTQMHTAMFCLLLACLPVSLLWANMGKLLILMGQDPAISSEAGKFTVWLIPALFGYGTLQPLVRYLQVQSLVTPMLISSCATVFFHIILCWALVLKFELNNIGAALAIGTLEWWSFEFLTLLSGLLPNPELEASVLSVCLATITTLFTIPDGLGAAASTRVSNALGAGNPQAAIIAVRAVLFLTVLETVVVLLEGGSQNLGAYANLTAYYHFGIPVAAALGFWLKMRGEGLWIGIQVGAFVQIVLLFLITSCQNWKKQKPVAPYLRSYSKEFGQFFRLAIPSAFTICLATISNLFTIPDGLGTAASNEKEVVGHGTTMAPLVCLLVILESLKCVLSGVARGCGWQDFGAYVYLAASYLCGIPVAAALGFWLKSRGPGIWIGGIQAGALLQTILLSIITSRTNWEKQIHLQPLITIKKLNVLSHSVANATSDILKPVVDSSCDLIIFFYNLSNHSKECSGYGRAAPP